MKKQKNKKKGNEKIVRFIILFAYLFIILLAFFDFYNLKIGDEIGYTLLYFYFLIPIITLIASICIGKSNISNIFKIILIIIISFMYISPLFGLVIKGEEEIFDLFIDYYDMIFNGLIISLVGLIIGLIINGHKFKNLNS